MPDVEGDSEAILRDGGVVLIIGPAVTRVRLHGTDFHVDGVLKGRRNRKAEKRAFDDVRKSENEGLD